MEKIKLNPKDKKYLSEIGYLDEDIPQISRTVFVFEYWPKKKAGYSIDAATAIRLVGRKSFISGIGRATFHWNAVSTNEHATKIVYIERAY